MSVSSGGRLFRGGSELVIFSQAKDLAFLKLKGCLTLASRIRFVTGLDLDLD